jgi:dipeptidyl aminopeptidase/acylaminoacyl peptidase
MTSPNGKLISSDLIELPRHEINAVTRMYGDDVLNSTRVEQITYWSDGLRINGFVARPKHPGNYPVLLWNRGGSGDRGALNNLTSHLILASTAAWGYVVLATHYRGCVGSEGVEDWGGEDIHDAQALLETAREIPGADLTRVGIEGASRGGMTTYRILAQDDRFRCAIVHAGVTDVVSLCGQKDNFARFCDTLLSKFDPEHKQEELRKRSAVHWADKLPRTAPILVLHGDRDTVIPLEQSEKFAAQLKRHSIPHEFHVVKGGGHVALKDGTYKAIDQLRRPWLEKYLKGV